MNFSFIWKASLSPGYFKRWRIFKMTAVALGPKTFQEVVFKTVKNRIQWLVDRQHRRIDRPKSVFLQDKVTLFETMMTTMNECSLEINFKLKIPTKSCSQVKHAKGMKLPAALALSLPWKMERKSRLLHWLSHKINRDLRVRGN